MKVNQKGFGLIGLLLGISLIVFLLGFMSWYFVHSQKTTQAGNNSFLSPQEKVKDKSNEKVKVSLLEGVNFSLPNDWIVNEEGCGDDYEAVEAGCIDSITLIPDEKYKTIYGHGTETFTVDVTVYHNTKFSTAEEWIKHSPAGSGYADEDDVSNLYSINDQEVYYIKYTNDFYEQVNYLLTSENTLVDVSAKIYEVSDSQPGRGDFRHLEPAIKSLAESIRFTD